MTGLRCSRTPHTFPPDLEIMDFIYHKKPVSIHNGGPGSSLGLIKLVLEVQVLASRFKMKNLEKFCETVIDQKVMLTRGNIRGVQEFLCSNTDLTDSVRKNITLKYTSMIRRQLARSCSSQEELKARIITEQHLFSTGQPSQLAILNTSSNITLPGSVSSSDYQSSSSPVLVSSPPQDQAYTSSLHHLAWLSPPLHQSSPHQDDSLFDAYAHCGPNLVVQSVPLASEQHLRVCTLHPDQEMSYNELLALVTNFKNLSKEEQEQLVRYIRVKEKEDPVFARRIKKEICLDD